MARKYHREFECGGLTGKYAAIMRRLTPRSSVLEIGCHTGYFTRALAAAGHDVLGVEHDPEAAAEATAGGSQVMVGDVEDPALLGGLDRRFDVILLMDVLEHLRDPVATLHRLRPCLNGGGRVLITGPNVAFFAVRVGLLLGRWEYQDTGILDRTHLRFYTKSAWQDMVQQSGYHVVDIEPVEGMIPLQTRLSKLLHAPVLVEWARQQAVQRASELFAIVYLIEARSRCPE